MSYDPNNIFAKILRGEMPAVRVFEDSHVLAFMDVFPQAKGHTLVIPKRHVADYFDLYQPERNAIHASDSDENAARESRFFFAEADTL